MRVLKIFCFQHSYYQGIRILNQPPTLLCNQGLVKTRYVSESHSFSVFSTTHLLTFCPVHSFSIFLRSPPKSCHAYLDFIAQPYRNFKNTHCICRDSLSYGFHQYFLASTGKNLCCQLDILFKTLSLISLKKLVLFLLMIEGKPKYFSCLDTTVRSKIFFIAVICPP